MIRAASRWLFLCVFGGVIGSLVVIGVHASAVERSVLDEVLNSPSSESRQAAVNSIANCMTSGCHGATDVKAPNWQRAGRIWFDEDPHAQAFTNLLSGRSLTIAENLTTRKYASTDDPNYRQFLRERCASCHAGPYASETQLVLGVDCQACHGPSIAWGSHHYTQAWKSQSGHRFDGTQMTNTEDLATRAKVCFSCHVGDLNSPLGPREVDHDLMAAGHPAMYVEWEAYWQAYPAHWNRQKDEERYGKSVAHRRWQIGNLVQAQSRFELLLQRCRAIVRGEKRSWPELSEYSCYNCHHSLSHPSWRQTRTANGTYDWDAWCIAGVRAVTPQAKRAQWEALLVPFEKAISAHPPDVTETIRLTEPIVAWIDSAIMELRAQPLAGADEIIEEVRRGMSEASRPTSWDASVHWYIGMEARLAALRRDANAPQPSLSVAAKIRESYLDGPEHFEPAKLSTRRQQLEELFRKYQP
jgi:Cytochrome c554 and c-prime